MNFGSIPGICISLRMHIKIRKGSSSFVQIGLQQFPKNRIHLIGFHGPALEVKRQGNGARIQNRDPGPGPLGLAHGQRQHGRLPDYILYLVAGLAAVGVLVVFGSMR